jgi:hypothetical protein
LVETAQELFVVVRGARLMASFGRECISNGEREHRDRGRETDEVEFEAGSHG